MSYSYDECYEVHEESVRKARKEHVCCACKLPIRAGDYYASVFIVFDGRTQFYKRCGACQKTHLHLRELCKDRDMWPREDLSCGLDYEEEWETEPPDEIAALPLLSADERGALLKPGDHADQFRFDSAVSELHAADEAEIGAPDRRGPPASDGWE